MKGLVYVGVGCGFNVMQRGLALGPHFEFWQGIYPVGGDWVKIDPTEVLGSFVCPTVGRTSLLTTSEITVSAFYRTER